MNGLSYHAFDVWWWPWVFLILAGWAANDAWRLLGVAFSGRLTETSPLFAVVRSVATALVAGVIAQLVLQPGGDLASTSLALRLGSVACGFAAFRLAGDSVVLGVAVGEAAFFAGAWAGL